MILLSYLGAHWTLFLLVVVSTVGLTAAAWFLKNWKLAAAAIVLVVAGLAYQAADMEGYKRKVAEDSKAQVSQLQKRILAMAMASQADSQRTTADAFLNSQLDALSRATPYNPGPCLSLDAARRVRAIGDGRDNPDTAPLPARRLTSLLQRRSGAP